MKRGDFFSFEWQKEELRKELQRKEDASQKGIPIAEKSALCNSTRQSVQILLNLSSLIALLFLTSNIHWAMSSWLLLFERFDILPIQGKGEELTAKLTTRMAVYFSCYSISSSLSLLPGRKLRREFRAHLLLVLTGLFFSLGAGFLATCEVFVVDPNLLAFSCFGIAATVIREAYQLAAFSYPDSASMLWAFGWLAEKSGAAIPLILLTCFKSAWDFPSPTFASLLAAWTCAVTVLIAIAFLSTYLEERNASLPQQTSKFPMKIPLLFHQSVKGQLYSWVFGMIYAWSSLILLRLSLFSVTAIEHYRENSSPNNHVSLGIGIGPLIFNTVIWYSSESLSLSPSVILIGLLVYTWSYYARWISLRAFALSQLLILPIRPAFESFVWEYCERMFGYQAYAPTWAILQIMQSLGNSGLLVLIVGAGWWRWMVHYLDLLILFSTAVFAIFLKIIGH